MTSTQKADTEIHLDSNHRTDIEPKTDVAPSIDKLRCWNDGLPIHKLPIELLSSIFECVLRTEATALMYHHQICTLSGVCARWLFVIHHSPRLWTTVAGIIKQEGLKKVLERSSGQLIDVEYNPQALGDSFQSHELHFVNFLDTVSSITRRWRTFIMETCDHLGDLPGDSLQFPVPNLERLAFINDFGWEMEDVELFGGNCPNLKHIHLESLAGFKWSQAAFRGLESLTLSEVSFDSVGIILDVIRDNPRLKALEIRHCAIREEIPANTQPVSLPNLQLLRAKFDNFNGLPCATKQFVSHISASSQCPLYISFVDINNEEDSFVVTFCEWLFGIQTNEVLQGVESFKLGFDFINNADGAVSFELFSGSANIKGGILGFRAEDFQYVLEYIQGIFERSHASEPFTTLKLAGSGFELFNKYDLSTPIKDLPPITRLELEEPIWSFPDWSEDVDLSEYVVDSNEHADPSEGTDSSEDVHDGSVLCTASPFSTVKSLILREASPNGILDIVVGALGDPRARTDSMSECRVENLDLVEVHVEEEDFTKVEAVVEVLRNHPRIGKVDLYITL